MTDCREANNRKQKVRQLQRDLYFKSKQDKEVRFYSLYDKICREDILWELWKQVKENKGAPGVDDVTIEKIIKDRKEQEIIDRIRHLLITKEYKFSAVRQVEIPKSKGGKRPLGIS